MYYDRRIPDALINLLLPDAPLGWLLPWLQSGAACAAGAHIQTRANRHGRKQGAIQLYLGRTSPLELRGRPAGRLRLHADAAYRAMAPDLFDLDLDPSELARLAGRLQGHAEDAAQITHRSFLDGEAVVHAGLMRRYGPLAGLDAPFLALDSEARVGFDRLADQAAFEATLPQQVGLPPKEDVPRKLDLVGIARGGGLLLVEVKADERGMARAAWQVAVHVARFRALVAQNPRWFADALGGVARQKARVGLLGTGWQPDFSGDPRLVPVVAAPDSRPDWAAFWRSEIAPVHAASNGMLADLRLWRLAEDGALLDDVSA